MGDPAGVGPEITLQAWQQLRGRAGASFGIIAPLSAFENQDHLISISDARDISSAFKDGLPVLPLPDIDVTPGRPEAANAGVVIESIEMAVDLALSGKVGGVVTNPISKDVLYQAGFKHPGHTEFLGQLTEGHDAPHPRGPVMMLMGGGLRAALVTIHTPLRDVFSQITEARIMDVARVVAGALRVDFGISTPRIALCGLNPHAGEGGALGREEIEIINPAAEKLRAEGIDITDALSADTMFHEDARKGYDAAIAMYHDQGLIPVKTLDFFGGANITLGLPIIRTSPDHGTAFNIAGQGIASAVSLVSAISIAGDMALQRAKRRYG